MVKSSIFREGKENVLVPENQPRSQGKAVVPRLQRIGLGWVGAGLAANQSDPDQACFLTKEGFSGWGRGISGKQIAPLGNPKRSF